MDNNRSEEAFLRRLEVLRNHFVSSCDTPVCISSNEVSNRTVDSVKSTHCPIYHPDIQAYEFRSYQDVKSLFDAPPDTIVSGRKRLEFFAKQVDKHPEMKMFLDWVIYQDGIPHNVLKNEYLSYISLGKVEEMKPVIEKTVDELLSGLPKGVLIDLQPTFTRQLSTRMICHLCGLNKMFVPRIIDATNKIEAASVTIQEKAALDAIPAMIDLHTIVTQLLEETRLLLAKNGENYPLIGTIGDHQHETFAIQLVKKERKQLLTPYQNAVILSTAFFGGNGTTSHFIANSVYSLLMHPDQLEILRKNPSLINQAVEELLRFIGSPARVFQRQAVSKISVGEVSIDNEGVLLNIRTANHDPQKFQDPDKLDILRNTAVPHLAFGSGRHMCPGRHLARLEAQIALTELFKRFPGLKFAVEPSAIKFKGMQAITILESLPIILQ